MIEAPFFIHRNSFREGKKKKKPWVNSGRNITNPDSSIPVWGITGESNLQWPYQSPWLQIKCPICENEMTEVISELLNWNGQPGVRLAKQGEVSDRCAHFTGDPPPVSTTTAQMKLRSMFCRAWRGICVHITDARCFTCGHSVYLIWCKDAGHIIASILSLLFTFTYIKQWYFLKWQWPELSPTKHLWEMLFITPALVYSH